MALRNYIFPFLSTFTTLDTVFRACNAKPEDLGENLEHQISVLCGLLAKSRVTVKDEDVAPPSPLSDNNDAPTSMVLPSVVPSGTPKRKARGKKLVYVVYVGLEVGLDYDWSSVAKHTNGVSGARHEGFSSIAEAEDAYLSAWGKGEVFRVDASGTPLASDSTPRTILSVG